MVGPSLRFDEKLFDLKMAELLPQMYGLAVDDTPLREALTIQEGSEEAPRGAYEVQLIDRYFVRLREQLQGIDRIAREVWQIQGEAVTPEFVREILFPKAMGAIDAWLKTHTHTSVARDTKDPYPARFRQVAVLEIPKLRREVNARYEIEARELEYQKAPAAHGGPQSRLDELGSIRGLTEDATKDTTLWLQADPSAEERAHVLAMQGRLADLDRIITRFMERRGSSEDASQWSQTVAEVLALLEKAREVRGNIIGKGLARIAARLPQELPGTKPTKHPKPKAPSPIKPVNTSAGIRLDSREPKASQVPHDPPIYFPSDLWPQTNVILLEAQRKFPLQTQTLELCKHVTSEMTPLFCEAVKVGKMKAGAMLCEGLGGMEDLLHFLLVHNDDGPHTGFGLSDKAFRLGQKVRQSDEWLALAKAIAGVQHNGDLRTDAKQAESRHAQHKANSAQDVESKPPNATATNERKSFVYPILDGKGWSINRLAVEAEVDFHTVNDYLKGRTRPNRSTRKQLADALGIAVDKLPR
jgi:hypothetical protein